METILCNSIVAEDGVVGMDGWITNSADVRIAVSVRAGMSPDTKKTTHPLDRRFALSTTVPTADVIRLPNGAEFCIRAVISRMLARGKCGGSERQICSLVDIKEIYAYEYVVVSVL